MIKLANFQVLLRKEQAGSPSRVCAQQFSGVRSIASAKSGAALNNLPRTPSTRCFNPVWVLPGCNLWLTTEVEHTHARVANTRWACEAGPANAGAMVTEAAHRDVPSTVIVVFIMNSGKALYGTRSTSCVLCAEHNKVPPFLEASVPGGVFARLG